MVDIHDRLEKIRDMIDKGDYFVINRGRQYGKTTTLNALETFLTPEYLVINLDFQLLSNTDFSTERDSYLLLLVRCIGIIHSAVL